MSTTYWQLVWDEIFLLMFLYGTAVCKSGLQAKISFRIFPLADKWRSPTSVASLVGGWRAFHWEPACLPQPLTTAQPEVTTQQQPAGGAQLLHGGSQVLGLILGVLARFIV